MKISRPDGFADKKRVKSAREYLIENRIDVGSMNIVSEATWQNTVQNLPSYEYSNKKGGPREGLESSAWGRVLCLVEFEEGVLWKHETGETMDDGTEKTDSETHYFVVANDYSNDQIGKGVDIDLDDLLGQA